MIRRRLIAMSGGTALTWPLASYAQQNPGVPRIGLVFPGPKAAAGPRAEAMLSGLRAVGYNAPAQIELVLRTLDGDSSRIDSLVEDVIAGKVNLLIAAGSSALNAARAATRTIPIVAIDLETDPVTSGVASSLARPDGNVTGVFLDFPDFTAEWIEFLLECNPALSRVAVLWDPATAPVQVEAVRKAAASQRIDIGIVETPSATDLESAFLTARQRDAGALVIASSPMFGARLHVLAELAMRHRLPAITLFPDFARLGGVLAYGPNLLGMWRLLGVVSGKVLRGEAPATYPIERPTKFELVLNLKTANALGLAIPASLLLRADEVIE